MKKLEFWKAAHTWLRYSKIEIQLNNVLSILLYDDTFYTNLVFTHSFEDIFNFDFVSNCLGIDSQIIVAFFWYSKVKADSAISCFLNDITFQLYSLK